MLLLDFQRWLINNDQNDAWWVAIEGDIQDDLLTLSDAFKLKEENIDSNISLLHESQGDDEDAEWQELTIPHRFRVVRDRQGYNTRFQIPSKKASKKPSGPTGGTKPPMTTSKPAEEKTAGDSESPTKPAAQTDEGEATGDKAPAAPAAKPDKADTVVSLDGDAAAVIERQNREISDLKEQLKTVDGALQTLKKQFAGLKSLVAELSVPIKEAKAMLDEREAFINKSEESLFERAQEQEVIRVELEQLREDLDDRERQLGELASRAGNESS